MVKVAAALAGQLVVFAQERRQFQGLEVIFGAYSWPPCRALAASRTHRVPAVIRRTLWTFLRSTYKCWSRRRHRATMTSRGARTPARIRG